jgi:SAM-dependent MidA family methyltransferase
MLKDIIQGKISKDGPMTVADYMSLCLGHPEYGYYMAKDPFGVAGDFTTAPEISQVFGEMIGAWLVQTWQDIGASERFVLLELGPGRGTLMSDILRISKKISPKFYGAARPCLVEMSPVLIEKQKEALSGHDCTWVNSLSEADIDRPILIIMNEFFDALPVHQFVWDAKVEKWMERCISQDFEWCLAQPSFDPRFLSLSEAPKDGDIMEFSPVAASIMRNLCDLIAEYGGALLSIDYGYAKSAYGDSLQAVCDHKYVDVLSDPGNADITYHIDFERMSSIASDAGLKVMPIATQGRFLKALGIEYRAEQLCSLNPSKREQISNAVNRLVSDEGMGQLFKVLGFSQTGTKLLGFENAYI